LQSQLSECRGDISRCESEYSSAISTAKMATTEIGKIEVASKHLLEQENDLKIEIASLRNTLDLSPTERRQISELQSRLDSIEAEMVRVSPQLGQCKSAVASIQRKIMDVGGPKLSKAQAKLDILTKQFDTLSSQVNGKEIDEANNRKQAIKSAASREKGEQEMQKLNDKLKELVAEQQEMETDALAVIKAVESGKERMSQQEELLKRITEEFQKLKAEVGKIKNAEVDLIVEIEHIQKDLKEANKQTDHWKKELELLRKLHLDEQQEFFAAVDAIVKADNKASTSSSFAAPNIIDTSTVESLPVLPTEQLHVYASDASYVEDLKKTIATLEVEKERLRGNVNMNALMEYLRKDAHYRGRLVDLEAITETRNTLRGKYEGLRRQRLEEFMAGFGVIALKLKEMYQMITLGGDAELELVDSLDPFSEGIVFSVRPPKKSWKNISNLSGGEKTLSSLALVFALHHYKPTPLYVMDEIDAALDFKNVSIVANYIKDRTKNAQFVIISLRNNMFELADRLVGIYKTNDATKSVTINPRMFVSVSQVSQAARANVQIGQEHAGLPPSLPKATNKMDKNDTEEFERASKVKRVGVLGDSTNV
jgi:structural maintenance of chromosome 4